MNTKLRIGVVGCGNISGIYLKNLTTRWPWVEVGACADIVSDRACAQAKAYAIPKSCSTEELLEDQSIDIILNLTTPGLHASLNLKALEAGKHVYVEKPFAVNRDDAAETLAVAEKKKLLTGCAPDTFLGAGIQTCRSIIERGDIGTVVSAEAFFTCRGHESWHPDPGFYYQKGGGPMLDMGPYYLTALVNLIGPMRRVMGAAGKAFDERLITAKEKYGEKIRVNTPTHLAGTVTFQNNAIATVVMSFDICRSRLPRIEIHGTKGSLMVPDPNGFDGPVLIAQENDSDWREIPLVNPVYAENSRGIGVADMALAILNNRRQRAGGQLAAHVLDAMLEFEESSIKGRAVDLKVMCDKPQIIPGDLTAAQPW